MNTNYPDRIGEALGETFPELEPILSVTVLKDGFRNVVVETPGGQVFKIARSWEASATFAKEVQCLPELGDHLPVMIPNPLWHASRSRQFPFGVVGYPKLPGTPLASDTLTAGDRMRLALAIGTFLATLHGITPDGPLASSLPHPDTRWYELGKTRDIILPLLRDELSGPDFGAAANWWDTFLSDPRMRACAPVIQHGNLEPDNVLLSEDSREMSGVVDFESLAIDDPALDIAAQLHLGRDFALAVLDQYQAAGGILDENVEYRVQRFWELRGFAGMRLAIHFENQRAFDRALDRLRRGPILNATTRRETSIWPQPQD